MNFKKKLGFMKARPGDFISLKSKESIAIQPNINNKVKIFPYQAYIEIKGNKIKQVIKPKAPIIIKVDPLVDAFMIVPQNEVDKQIAKLKKRHYVKEVVSMLKRWSI